MYILLLSPRRRISSMLFFNTLFSLSLPIRGYNRNVFKGSFPCRSMTLRAKERAWTDNSGVFIEQVACALAGNQNRSLYLRGHFEEPLPVQGTTLLRCNISFGDAFTDMDGCPRRGYEYRAQYTEEGAVSTNASEEFLRNTCTGLASRLAALEPSVYGLSGSIRASVLGRGISVLC